MKPSHITNLFQTVLRISVEKQSDFSGYFNLLVKETRFSFQDNLRAHDDQSELLIHKLK